jgi:hypothetical protein
MSHNSHANLDAALFDRLNEVMQRLDHLTDTVASLVEQRTAKDWYTTAEVARLLGKAEFTVREWCRQRRVEADKRPCGRGRSREWIVSHEELTRVRNEGLLPLSYRPLHDPHRLGKRGTRSVQAR